jgi:hydroxyethylthiazole kinase-like uncharacterized protein yjeF
VVKALTVLEAKRLDLRAIKSFGVPSILLMENAGRAVSIEAFKNIGSKKPKIAIICGKGNNGGDGFSAARHLMARGIDPDLYLCAGFSEVKGEARINLNILLKLKKKVFIINDKSLKAFKKRLASYGLIVDSIFGVGLKGVVKGIIAEVINIINQSNVRVISVDLPSGIDADTGEVLGIAVKADTTVTFIAPKLGMLKGHGKEFCGKIIVQDLGFPFYL